jgi:hypothetical protein
MVVRGRIILGRIDDEEEEESIHFPGLGTPFLSTKLLSTKNSFPCPSLRNGREHCELAQWLSMSPLAGSHP